MLIKTSLLHATAASDQEKVLAITLGVNAVDDSFCDPHCFRVYSCTRLPMLCQAISPEKRKNPIAMTLGKVILVAASLGFKVRRNVLNHYMNIEIYWKGYLCNDPRGVFGRYKESLIHFLLGCGLYVPIRTSASAVKVLHSFTRQCFMFLSVESSSNQVLRVQANIAC